MGRNKNIIQAKKNKKDEFYTRYEDIEPEINNYKAHLQDKIIYCNCDDPKKSAFWAFFYNNFHAFKLKGLVATYYNHESPSIMTYYDGRNITRKNLRQNGDFRSKECSAILDQCDVVITNPPFSLFREYVAQLMKYNKKFLIIGSIMATTYKNIFPYIKDNKLWLGVNKNISKYEFMVPDHYPMLSSSGRIDENGNKFTKVNGIRWYTNLEHSKRNEKLSLYMKYYGNEDDYPKYDNYEKAIEISRVKHIPTDYEDEMGVPITFLDKYNPCQFEIIHFRKGDDGKDLKVNEKELYVRIIIKRKKDTNKTQLYPKYDNYNAVNIDRVEHIPVDYKGEMGVPVTFLDKYNPCQFEIIGQMANTKITDLNFGYPFINKIKKYARIIIKRKK